MTTSYHMNRNRTFHEGPEGWGLPDAETQPDFYDAVNTKRVIAFVIDLLIVAVLSALILPLTAFLGIFFFPFLMAVVSFAYRIVTIANGSATLGMRIMGIEFRTSRGDRFDMGLALLHTGLFYVWGTIFLAQIASIVLMLTSARKQGLSDFILGTAVINRPSRF